jgi:hypothetical protein
MFGQSSGGTNLADYKVATAGLVVNLLNPSMNTGFATGDTYSNVHDIAGSAYDDILYADNNVNANLLGGNGDNILYAGTGTTR